MNNTVKPTGLFLLQHAVVPGFVLSLMFVFIHHYQIDYMLADGLYQLGGNHWPMRHQWFFEKVLHEGGKVLSWFIVIIISGLLAASFYCRNVKSFRKGLVFLICIPLLSVATVNILKALSGTACPAEILRYGGTRFLQNNWTLASLGHHGCTPSGHSSSGYAWLALYFFALTYFPRWRLHALLPGFLMGIIFGLSQQIRGEHFLSHDLFTLAICWYSSLSGFLLFWGASSRQI